MVGNSVITILFVIGIVFACQRLEPAYPHLAYATGWLLFAVVLFLTFFNMRKRVPFLRLGSASTWLQMHIYVGVFSGALFFAHVGFTWPEGAFRQLIAVCFILVFLSGVLGLYISKAFPRMLTAAGCETPYEYLPQLRNKVKGAAEELIAGSGDEATSPIMAKFYTSELRGFFAGPRNYGAHIRQSRRPAVKHEVLMNDLRRYIKGDDRNKLDELQRLVLQKHALDYQHALQSSLRLWLFAHIPLTYALLVFTAVHIFLVYAFSSAVT